MRKFAAFEAVIRIRYVDHRDNCTVLNAVEEIYSLKWINVLLKKNPITSTCKNVIILARPLLIP
jgi:hypothetical protein